MIIIWKCTNCNSIQISNSKIKHQMDVCNCGNCAIDLEEDYSRSSQGEKGKIEIIKQISHKEFNIWNELLICVVSQDMFIKMENKCFIPLELLQKLNIIEKEIYLSFIT